MSLGQCVLSLESSVFFFGQDFIASRPDPKYINNMLVLMGMEECNGVPSPMVKRSEAEEPQQPVDQALSSKYDTCVGTLGFITKYRKDIQYATRQLAKARGKATQSDLLDLKRCLRYLAGTRYQCEIHKIDTSDGTDLIVEADADWASGSSRKSTSAGMIFLDGVCLASWCRGQAVIAYSSGESELYSIISAMCEAMFVQTVLQEMGYKDGLVKIRLRTDSAAAKGTLSRVGLGKLKHVDIKLLWAQERIAERDMSLEKVATRWNRSDLNTKVLGPERLAELLDLMRIGTFVSVDFGDPKLPENMKEKRVKRVL